MSARLASSSAAQQHAAAHFANGTVTGHDTLADVSQQSLWDGLYVRTFRDWVAGAAIVYQRRVV